MFCPKFFSKKQRIKLAIDSPKKILFLIFFLCKACGSTSDEKEEPVFNVEVETVYLCTQKDFDGDHCLKNTLLIKSGEKALHSTVYLSNTSGIDTMEMEFNLESNEQVETKNGIPTDESPVSFTFRRESGFPEGLHPIGFHINNGEDIAYFNTRFSILP